MREFKISHLLKSKAQSFLFKTLFFLAAVFSIFALGIICLFLLLNGAPAIREIGALNFLTGREWKPLQNLFGILPMIAGSVYVTALALALGVPLGVLCAVFLARFCPKRLYKIAKPAVNLMAGIPSVIYGFFGLSVIVPVIQRLTGTSGKSVLAASVMLAIMILPTIVSVSEASIRAVDESYYEGARALGSTREQAVFFCELMGAKQGIGAGIVLGTGRAIGEALAVSMVAGNQAVMPKSILGGVRTLTSNIVLEMGYAADLHREALIATAVVLFVFVMIINICFKLIKGGTDA